MRERVLVTALSLCMILAICPNVLAYAGNGDFQIDDLINAEEADMIIENLLYAMDRIDEEVSEEDTSVFDTSKYKLSSDSIICNVQNESAVIRCRDFSENVDPESENIVSLAERSVQSLRAPPEA